MVPDYKVPKAALEIMELIRGAEVTKNPDPSQYDVIHGFKQRYLKKRITQMTLLEVQKGQSKQWDNHNGGVELTVSSATGAYQFMYKTLGGLIEEFDLPHGMILNPPLQDWLGYQLLIRRGFFKWKQRKISDTTFGNNLAKEWASFPVLGGIKGKKRGQSYYAGDGLNAAKISPEEVESMLESARRAGFKIVNVETMHAGVEPPPPVAPTPDPVQPGYKPDPVSEPPRWGKIIAFAIFVVVIAFFIWRIFFP